MKFIIHFDNNMYTLGVFIDLSKAFDTVDHELLLLKLDNYGIRGTNLKWFKDYLSNRKQCLQYDNKMTTMKRHQLRGSPGIHSWTPTFYYLCKRSTSNIQIVRLHTIR